MKDWEDVIKGRLAVRKAELPESDWNDFLSRKALHERAAIRRRRLITLSVSIPAAAAVLLLLLLVPFRTAVPENQISQNQPSEPQTVADSIATPVDTIVKELPPVVMEKPKVEIAQAKPEVKKETEPIATPKPLAQGLSVKGTVYDPKCSEPLSPAAVDLYIVSGKDSTFIGGTATDDNGVFVFDNLPAGNYFARTRFIGYDNKDTDFTLRAGSATTDIGGIAMEGSQMLAEVAITSQVSKVQMFKDSVFFNVAAYKLPEGASVEDLIRKLPGVQIDSAGRIFVNGKEVSRILVNGKEFFNENNEKSLTQLTAEMIQKVKAYEARSSAHKYPVVILDGDTIDVADDRLAEYDFETTDKNEIASLVGVKARKIKSTVLSDGVYEVQTKKYSRKAGRAGK
ncbi:MAG: carboxypeptidase regulatory-like domain-containing protein [Bacteroidaceae bacterium]|nr:carboxypeptidase regulatory-like domain-containing protein [Bacteroidaceae bacterium]